MKNMSTIKFLIKLIREREAGEQLSVTGAAERHGSRRPGRTQVKKGFSVLNSPFSVLTAVLGSWLACARKAESEKPRARAKNVFDCHTSSPDSYVVANMFVHWRAPTPHYV